MDRVEGEEGLGKVSASVRSHVVRARFEVEVVGDVEDVNRIFANVVHSVAEAFPDMRAGVDYSSPDGGEDVEETEQTIGKSRVRTRTAHSKASGVEKL